MTSKSKLFIAASITISCLTIFGMLAINTPAFAQIDEIIVTARKTPESQQDVPIAVSTVTAADFEARNITNIDRLDEIAPNVTIDSTAPISGSSNATSIFIRGVGQTDFVPTSDPGVGVYLDGVYIARSTGGLLDLKDVEQVEILRGPQGTLFGKNTIGGAVNVTTIKPSTDDFFGEAKLTTGRYNRLDFEGAINIPVSEKLAVRLSGKQTESDGYGKRLRTGESLGGEDRYTIRGSVRLQASDRVTIDLAADYSDADEESPVSTTVSGSNFAAGAETTILAGLYYNNLIGPLDSTKPASPIFAIPRLPAETQPYNAELIETGSLFTSNATGPTGSEYEIWGINATITFDISDNLSLKSITAYRDQETHFGRDPDGSPLELVHTTNTGQADQFSQEVQLLGERDKLNWIVGAYYLEESGNDAVTVPFMQETFSLLTSGEQCTLTRPAPLPPLTLACEMFNIFRVDNRNGGTLFDNESIALFGELSYAMTDRLTLTGGLRWTEDKKSVNLTGALGGGVPLITDTPIAEETFDELTPRIIIDYQARDDLLLYGSYSQGFKSGGFNPRYGLQLPAPTSFEPETVDSFEIGGKADFWDNRARVNAAVFVSTYDDIQVVVFDNTIPRTINAAEGEISGLEVEATVQPDDRWLIQASLGLLDAEYTELAPAITGSFGTAINNPLNTDLMFVNTPDKVASLGVQYRQDIGSWGDLTYRVDASYKSEWANDAVNTAELMQDSIILLNGRLTLTPEDSVWNLVLYGTNLTDEEYITSGVADEPGFGLVELNAARPREWGASIGVKF